MRDYRRDSHPELMTRNRSLTFSDPAATGYVKRQAAWQHTG